MTGAIRIATIADSAAIARLVGELGYPSSAEQMARRLEAILGADDYETLVACAGEEILGFAGTRSGPRYEADGRYGQIIALAVTAAHRRQGVGRRLMEAAESRLIARGARELVLTSGHHRAGAHAFYESLGYAFTGRRYKKRVRSGE